MTSKDYLKDCPPSLELPCGVSRTPESAGSAFIPFGVEWEKMMMRKNKLEIVKMLRSALMPNPGVFGWIEK